MLSGHSGWSFWKASAMAERSASTQTVIFAVGSCATVGKPYWLPVEEPADPVGPLVGVPEAAVPAGPVLGAVPAQPDHECDAGCGCGHPPQRAGRSSLTQRHVVAPVLSRVDLFDHSWRRWALNHTCDVLAIGGAGARHISSSTARAGGPATPWEHIQALQARYSRTHREAVNRRQYGLAGLLSCASPATSPRSWGIPTTSP